MKVRLTIMTENDKHPGISLAIPEDKEYAEKKIANAWELILYMLSKDPSDKVTVEKCEIVEV